MDRRRYEDHLTPARICEMLYERGMSVADIAEAYCVNKSTIWRLFPERRKSPRRKRTVVYCMTDAEARGGWRKRGEDA